MHKEIDFYVLDRNENVATVLSSAGIGQHTPVIAASVDEKLSSYDVLTMTIPADAANADKVREDFTLVFKDIKGWREYIITNIEDIDGDAVESTITAELSSIELLDEIILKEQLRDSKDPYILLEDILEGTRWKVGYVDESIYNNTFNEPLKYVNVLEAVGKLSSAYSTEVSFSYTIDGNKIKDRFVNLSKEIGEDKGKRFEVDKDVSEITRTIDTADIKTAVIAYGPEPEEAEEGQPQPERLTIENAVWDVSNGDPVNKPLGQPYVGDPVALEQWGKVNPDGSKRHRFLAMEINGETEEQLLSMAWVNLGRYTKPKMTYEATVMNLYALTGDEDLLHENTNLGDKAVIIDRYFTEPLMIQTRVVEQVRDLLDPVNNEIVLGDSKQTFKVSDVKATVEELTSKVSQATYKANYAQLTAGGNYSYGGSQEPTAPAEGDIWFRPNPVVTGAIQFLRYTGTTWNLVLDTADLSRVEGIAEEASNEARDSVERSDKAVNRADDAISRAEDAITHTNEEVKRVEDAFNVKLSSKVDDDTLTTEIKAVTGLLQSKVSNEEFSSYQTQLSGVLQSKVGSDEFESYQTQTDREINLRVKEGDVVNQINVSDEGILIDGSKLHITASTSIDNAVITSAMIQGLSADKLTSGEIDAGEIDVINLTASNITGGDLDVRNVRIMNGETPVLAVRGGTNEVEMNVSKLTINSVDVEQEIQGARDYAESTASTAESNAKAHADSTASAAETAAKSHADTVSEQAEEDAKLYADQGLADKTDQDVFNLMLEDLAVAKSQAEDAINSGTFEQFIEGYENYQDITEAEQALAEQTLADVQATVSTIENNLGDSSEKWNFIDNSITASNDGISISNEESSMSVFIAEDRISFFDGGVEVAFISNKVLQINHGIFVQSAQIGAHLISSLPENNDITVMQWVGTENLQQ